MKNKVKDYMLITIGCVIAGIGTALFLLPNRLSSGGFAGIAMQKLPIGRLQRKV